MEHISLSNYRCFEHLALAFAPGVNLLIGDNGSGKTTLVRAISSVLNSFFVGFSDENTRFIGLSKDDFRIVETETGLANEEMVIISFGLLHVEASLVQSSKKGRTQQGSLVNILAAGRNIYQGLFKNGKQVMALPLWARFSTSGIHSPKRLNQEIFKQYAHKPSFGYYECLQGDSFLDYWTTRLIILREGETGEKEVQGVLQALLSLLGNGGCNLIEDVRVRPRQGKVYYHLIDGRITETAQLSDGLRRLVNIGMDLAFRCMVLNQGIYGLDACAKTEGTVLIDEIDLHLHPTLQATVVKGLQNAFPKLQFIITSHAPMVMSSISLDAQNKIFHLTYSKAAGYQASEIQTYGLDASTIIEGVLGVAPRSQAVEDQLRLLFGSIDAGEYAAARQALAAMRAEFGDTLPELAKAETMLHFLTDEEHDPNP